MAEQVVVNEDQDDLIEEAHQALTDLLVAADYLEGKGYDKEIARAERSQEQLRRYLYTPQTQRISVYERSR